MESAAVCENHETTQEPWRAVGWQAWEMGIAAARQEPGAEQRKRQGRWQSRKQVPWMVLQALRLLQPWVQAGLLCLQTAKGPQKGPPGVPAKNPKPASNMEQALKKQIADAKDQPALQHHLQAALAAVQNQKREALPVKDQRAHLLE
eukprot:4173179-Amphidinium_carterae.1